MKLGRALGGRTDADAIERCATIAGVQAVTLLHATAMGTLANLPTHAVRTLMQVARTLPDMPAVDIGDLAPLDLTPVNLLVNMVRPR